MGSFVFRFATLDYIPVVSQVVRTQLSTQPPPPLKGQDAAIEEIKEILKMMSSTIQISMIMI